MAVEFNFIRRDENKRCANDKSLPLVRFVIEHEEFFKHLCEFITTYTKEGCLDRKNEYGINTFSEWINFLDFDDEDSFELVEKFEKLCRETYTIDNKKNNLTLGDIRGKVLENLVEEFIKPRYTPDKSKPFGRKFETGCEVEVNKKSLITSSRRTVDIAAWDGKFGEFYEAKVGPHRFGKDEMEILTLIKDNTDKLNIQTIVGCISMQRVDKILSCLEKLKEEEGVSYNKDIKIFGTDNMLSLKQCQFTILA